MHTKKERSRGGKDGTNTKIMYVTGTGGKTFNGGKAEAYHSRRVVELVDDANQKKKTRQLHLWDREQPPAFIFHEALALTLTPTFCVVRRTCAYFAPVMMESGKCRPSPQE